MKIEASKIVALSYELKVDGDVMETVTKDKPMQFMFGTGYLLPKFEENIVGKVVGDKFEFILKSDEAYGNVEAEAVVELPKDIFLIDGAIDESVIYVGNQVPMRDQEGNLHHGVVEAINPEAVTMNFNHPLAGSDLHFKGEVVEVRDATPEDLASGGGCSCGCGDGDCDDNCGDDCGCGCDDDHKHNG